MEYKRRSTTINSLTQKSLDKNIKVDKVQDSEEPGDQTLKVTFSNEIRPYEKWSGHS